MIIHVHKLCTHSLIDNMLPVIIIKAQAVLLKISEKKILLLLRFKIPSPNLKPISNYLNLCSYM